MLIAEVARSLRSEGVQFGVAGGFAVALHGAVRGTLDLDLVLALDLANYEAAERALTSMGFVARLPLSARDVFENRKDYVENRNLIAWSFIDPKDPSRIVDVLLVWEDLTVPTLDKFLNGEPIPVLSKQHLIEMKRKSGRPQDKADVRALESLP